VRNFSLAMWHISDAGRESTCVAGGLFMLVLLQISGKSKLLQPTINIHRWAISRNRFTKFLTISNTAPTLV
jgi:hypothetical protein